MSNLTVKYKYCLLTTFKRKYINSAHPLCSCVFYKNDNNVKYKSKVIGCRDSTSDSTNYRTFSVWYPSYKYFEGFSNRILYEPTPKGKYKKKPEKSNYEYIKDGLKEVKYEVRKWQEEMKEKLTADPIFVMPGDTDKVFDFKSEEDLKLWKVTSDSDHLEGNSKGSLTLSPAGHGLFSGVIDKTVPEVGHLKYAGYSNMMLIQPTKSFKRDVCFDWFMYTHLVMRIRGDGRRYLILLKATGDFDVSWFDIYKYILYTRGGPYWQDVKIPFSKFFLGAAGRVQDKQYAVPLNRIKSIGFTASDRVSAPFRLEIDYIGVHCDPSHDEKTAYEKYRIPPYIITG